MLPAPSLECRRAGMKLHSRSIPSYKAPLMSRDSSFLPQSSQGSFKSSQELKKNSNVVRLWNLTSGKVICGTPVAIDGLEFGVSIEGSCCTPVTIGVIRGHACFRI